MDRTVLVSVVIPCYNYGVYIDDVIDSVLNQTHKSVEVIVVDDGSTDEFTQVKLKQYSNMDGVRMVFSENKGPAAARNLGFSLCYGEYILLLDADDLVHETFLEKSIAILDRYPRIGAVSSWTLCFGNHDGIWYPLGGDVENFKIRPNSPVCALVRREAWIAADGFDETFLVGYEDWDFWIRVTKKKWLVYVIPEILFFYRQKANSRVKETISRHAEIYEQIKLKHPDVYGSD